MVEELRYKSFLILVDYILSKLNGLKGLKLNEKEKLYLYRLVKDYYSKYLLDDNGVPEILGRKKICKFVLDAYNEKLSEQGCRKLSKFIRIVFSDERLFKEFKDKVFEIFGAAVIGKGKKGGKSYLDKNVNIDDNETLFLSLLKDSLNEIKIEVVGNYSSKSKGKKNVYGSSKDESAALLLLSDWHILELVNPEEINNVNKFDINVAVRRVEKIFEKVEKIISLHRKYSKIEKLYVWLGGDMVSGTIHDELIKYGNLTITEQIALTAYLIAALLKELSQIFKEIEVFSVVGNHGRITKKKEAKKRFNSYDYIAYQIAALLLKDVKNINWEITKSMFVFKDIEGHRFCFSHGDEIKSWNGIPFYGLRRDFGTKQNMNFYINQFQPTNPMVYYVVGHFHVPSQLYDGAGYIIMNGTLKGIDEYSFSKGWLTRPSQKLLLINKKYGIECSYDLWLDDEHWSQMRPQRYKVEIPDLWKDF